jgi:Zn-finger nucleic acid-binding protein
MDAATLNCPMCGAPSASDATQCEHCRARLATVACPSCFGLIFLGSKFCQHCGAKTERAEGAEAAPKPCPHCRSDLSVISLGATNVHECPKCEGLWVDVDTFNAICADREKQALVIGSLPVPGAAASDFKLDDVRYIPCPQCRKLMNRVNFAHNSGVVLDICKAHGVWFDREELRRIVEFIRAGGLGVSRERDHKQWEAAKRQKSYAPGPGPAPWFGLDDAAWGRVDVFDVIAFIGRVVWTLWK